MLMITLYAEQKKKKKRRHRFINKSTFKSLIMASVLGTNRSLQTVNFLVFPACQVFLVGIIQGSFHTSRPFPDGMWLSSS